MVPFTPKDALDGLMEDYERRKEALEAARATLDATDVEIAELNHRRQREEALVERLTAQFLARRHLLILSLRS